MLLFYLFVVQNNNIDLNVFIDALQIDTKYLPFLMKTKTQWQQLTMAQWQQFFERYPPSNQITNPILSKNQNEQKTILHVL
jgi:hypothetical protein